MAKKRSLVSINDLYDEEIEGLFTLADEMGLALKRREMLDLCRGMIMATLFYEPSTRTRLSFETAMLRLGGMVISVADAMKASSAAKGESIRDTVRVVQNYADIIVMRHPADGSTKLAAHNTDVPLVSGGDGTHEHPTQTLCDLYTIRREKESIKGMRVALCGDLKYGRTVHSLAYGLARFGAKLVLVAPLGFEMPPHVLNWLKYRYNCTPETYCRLDEPLPASTSGRRSAAHLLFDDVISDIDVIYLTRIQRERFQTKGEAEAAEESYSMNAAMLKKAKSDALILHPLPRQAELSYKIDEDRRAGYFRQVAYGVMVRMALVAFLLGLKKIKAPKTIEAPIKFVRAKNARCANEKCIIKSAEGTQPRFVKSNGTPGAIQCYWCDQEIPSENDKTGLGRRQVGLLPD